MHTNMHTFIASKKNLSKNKKRGRLGAGDSTTGNKKPWKALLCIHRPPQRHAHVSSDPYREHLVDLRAAARADAFLLFADRHEPARRVDGGRR